MSSAPPPALQLRRNRGRTPEKPAASPRCGHVNSDLALDLAQHRLIAELERLVAAGALILAKANLTELARGGTTVSSLGGQTKNPYVPSRTPGGSSGGTGAAIAANFGAVGTGSDTGQSIRSPASAGSLVGIRPTRGLISRDGIIPLGATQDAAGPITRTVEDAARMLDAMAGYDPRDPITAFSHDKIPESYTHSLRRDGLVGARIGVLLDFFGDDAHHEDVNTVTETVLAQMTDLGATMVRMRIPHLNNLIQDLAVSGFEAKIAFNAYLADLGPGAPVRTLAGFIERGTFHESIRGGIEADHRNGGTPLRCHPLPPPTAIGRADRRTTA